jgi:hypothetical protein
MRAITEKKWRNLPNAWGRYADSAEQLFEIEPADVGKSDRNYLGQEHSTYTFRASDVGRTIAVYTDKGSWTCWCWSKAVQS